MTSDEELFARTRAGDMKAFDTLYERYETRLFGFLVRQLGSRQEAEDALHETFMGALGSGPIDFERATFCTWLFRIARNGVLNRHRSALRRQRALTRLDEPSSPPPPDYLIEAARREQALHLAVQGLPTALADVYHLRVSGLSYEEMASVLEIPIGTIKSRMHTMVAHLRGDLSSWTAP